MPFSAKLQFNPLPHAALRQGQGTIGQFWAKVSKSILILLNFAKKVPSLEDLKKISKNYWNQRHIV